MEEYSMTALFNISGAWTDFWSAALPMNGYLIVDPNSRPSGFDLGRHLGPMCISNASMELSELACL
jgi:hypothetical protein